MRVLNSQLQWGQAASLILTFACIGSCLAASDGDLVANDYTLTEYEMEDVVVTVVSPDVALIRYGIRAQYAYKGKVLPVDPIVASAVWIKKGGVWKAATYQEVVRKP